MTNDGQCLVEAWNSPKGHLPQHSGALRCLVLSSVLCPVLLLQEPTAVTSLSLRFDCSALAWLPFVHTRAAAACLIAEEILCLSSSHQASGTTFTPYTYPVSTPAAALPCASRILPESPIPPIHTGALACRADLLHYGGCCSKVEEGSQNLQLLQLECCN
ncbi:hypothetical protein K402DRAFT_66153 [Aulographum hederae CBS 113979]|uniref:Uncharacterized protein n=1 Tax=Aulographum hederae CBS 113979 TaxID=1176131 RepID=A0A6G1H137_9PEZI|nr:hypothetical protein K402DRAFT_66153 [Aulographum hederae CBS 113979]